MRSLLSLALGMLVGQWLAFGALPSPADFHALGVAAWQERDYAGALRHWSEGVTQRPDDPLLHYRRGTALAQLGQWHAAADSYRLALLLEPPPALAQLAREGLAQLHAARDGGGVETTVTLEPLRGVWVATVLLNGDRRARFLVDTGSSVTIVAPALAAALGLRPAGSTVELQTVGGPAAGPAGTVAMMRVGDVEARNVPVVVHDPGSGIDGILGNSFLGRYRVTLDSHRRLLFLTSSASH